MVKHVRPWSYDAHVSLQHVEELGKLIYVGLTHEIAELKLSGVFLRGLHCVAVFIDMHGAELQAIEHLAVYTRALLAEEDGARALCPCAVGGRRWGQGFAV